MQMYNGMRVLAVALRKGGVGKTLFSVLNAQYFGHVSDKGYRVLLLDMDPQQNASESLIDMDSDNEAPDHRLPPVHPDYSPDEWEEDEWDGRYSTADIFLVEPEHLEISAYPSRFERLDVLPATGDALLSVELVHSEEVKQVIVDRLEHFLNDPDLQSAYDLVIIDTPPGKGPINRAVLRLATHVIYPVMPSPLPVAGLRSMLQFERVERRLRKNPIKIVGAVPNLVNMQTNLHREYMEIMRDDPIISPYLTDFHVANRIAFQTINKPGISPDNIWKFVDYPEAKADAFRLCEYVESKLFGED